MSLIELTIDNPTLIQEPALIRKGEAATESTAVADPDLEIESEKNPTGRPRKAVVVVGALIAALLAVATVNRFRSGSETEPAADIE